MANSDAMFDDDLDMMNLHTDQQTLIFGEMINTRNRLEEENNELRDKLQDAELMIRVLKFRLKKANRLLQSRTSDKRSIRESIELNDKSIKESLPIEAFNRLQVRKKQKHAFENTAMQKSKPFHFPLFQSSNTNNNVMPMFESNKKMDRKPSATTQSRDSNPDNNNGERSDQASDVDTVRMKNCSGQGVTNCSTPALGTNVCTNAMSSPSRLESRRRYRCKFMKLGST